MNFLKNIHKLFLFVSSSIFIYISYLLLSNVSKGFDITDESFYILSAFYPNEIFSTITHEGYYTGLLYLLSNYNLSYFRLYGIVLLIVVSIWFTRELYKYLSQKLTLTFTILDKLLLIIPISVGSLSYYKLWLISPSYNWLALISVILVFTFLFRIVSNKEINYNRYFALDYLLLSFSLSLSFMAKPTTALILVLISILFLIYEFKNMNLKKVIPSVITFTSIIVILHILILDGGFSSYYNRLIESMERMSLMGGGHTLGNRYTDMIALIQKFFFEEFYFHQINNLYIYSVLLIVNILYIVKNKINVLYLYSVLMFLVLVLYSYFMFDYGFDKNFNLMWIRSIELLLLNLILVITAILFIDKKMEFLNQIVKIIPFLFILILGSFAYKFGSGNQIIHVMSGSMIFIVTPLIVLNFIFDQRMKIKIFTALSGLILSIFIYHSLYYAYEHPYRLITNITGQNKKVALLGSLEVDETTKLYIENIQKIAFENKEKNEKISLIDMTGGSPGANVILDAKLFGVQWLLGAYPGSNGFAERILKPYQGTNRLKKAWVLVAPKGVRKLNLNILNNIGLNFPDNYKKIGTVKTSHRNEIQELWKPISTSN